MFESRVDYKNGIVVIILDGIISQEEVDKVYTQLEEIIQQKGKVKILEDLRNFEFTSLTPSLIWKGIIFDFKHLKDVSHCAVVSDMGWIGPVSKAAGAFLSCEIRVFPLEQHDTALQWLKNQNSLN